MFEDFTVYTAMIHDTPTDFRQLRKAESTINTLILLQEADTSAQEMALLDKMLAALQVPAEKVEIWQFPDEPTAIWAGIRQVAPKHVLLFGISPAEAGMHMQVPVYQASNFSGTALLFSDSLAKLNTDTRLKTPLWKELQVIYGL